MNVLKAYCWFSHPHAPKAPPPPPPPPLPPAGPQNAADVQAAMDAQNAALTLQNHRLGMSGTILTGGSGAAGYANTVRRRTLLSPNAGLNAGSDPNQRLGS